MSRFIVGQKVWYGRGKHERQYVVARVIDNPLIPVYQYSFEAPHSGFACGEQSLRENQHDRDLKISECYKEDFEKDVETKINTIASALRTPVSLSEYGVNSDIDVLFKPDLLMTDWIINHANGRLIIDVGSGQGHLVRMLKMRGARAIGLEPNLDKEWWIKWRLTRDGANIDVNEILDRTIQESTGLISSLGKDKVMLIFARPKSRKFVEIGIENMPKGMEALYINSQENYIKETLTDLGKFLGYSTEISHQGFSEDSEKVYSIII